MEIGFDAGVTSQVAALLEFLKEHDPVPDALGQAFFEELLKSCQRPRSLGSLRIGARTRVGQIFADGLAIQVEQPADLADGEAFLTHTDDFFHFPSS